MFGSKKKGGLCTTCSIVELIICIIAVIAGVAAIIGVYQAHFLPEGVAFGTTSGSLSLVALVMTLLLVRKCMVNCPCNLPKK